MSRRDAESSSGAFSLDRRSRRGISIWHSVKRYTLPHSSRLSPAALRRGPLMRLSVSRCNLRLILVSAVLALTIPVVSCNQKQPQSSAQADNSRINVMVNAGGPLVLRTSSAEFQLNANGYLQASLLRDGQKLTLDDAQADPQ